MKMTYILLAGALAAFAQQNFDFTLLDRIGANAKESTNITLDGDALKLATKFLGDGKGSFSSVAKSLQGVYVRGWEFDKTGQYDPADLAPLRAYLKTLQWNKIVDVKEAHETSEIYLQPLPNNQLAGLAIVTAEPKEVTVVFIKGVMNMSDVEKLGGNLGIPDIRLEHGGRKADSPGKN